MPSNQEVKKIKRVLMYTKATDGSGDFSAARKMLPFLLKNDQIHLIWIVQSSQPNIEEEIIKLQNSNHFPRLQITNIDEEPDLTAIPSNIDLIIVMPNIAPSWQIGYVWNNPKTKLLTIAEYDFDSSDYYYSKGLGSKFFSTGLGQESYGVLIPEAFVETQGTLSENKGLHGFQLECPFFWGYSNLNGGPFSSPLISFIKNAIIIANKENHDDVQIVMNIRLHETIDFEQFFSDLKEFFEKEGIQKFEYHSRETDPYTKAIKPQANGTNKRVGKTLKIFNPFFLTPQEFQFLLHKSHPMTLCTGDQSLIENIFALKLVIYQVMRWKKRLSLSFKKLVKEVCGDGSLYYEFISIAIDDPQKLPELLKEKWNENFNEIVKADAKKIADNIKNEKNFIPFFQILLNLYLNNTPERLKMLREIVKNAKNFGHILADFKNEHVQICQNLQHQFSGIITTRSDIQNILVSLTNHLSEREQCLDVIFTAIKDNLGNIINKVDDLLDLLNLSKEELPLRYRNQILNEIKLEGLIQYEDQILELFKLSNQQLTLEHRTLVLDAVKYKLSNWNHKKLLQLFELSDQQLSVEQRITIWNMIKLKLRNTLEKDDYQKLHQQVLRKRKLPNDISLYQTRQVGALTPWTSIQKVAGSWSYQKLIGSGSQESEEKTMPKEEPLSREPVHSTFIRPLSMDDHLTRFIWALPYYKDYLPWNKPKPYSEDQLAYIRSSAHELVSLTEQFTKLKSSRAYKHGMHRDDFNEVEMLINTTKKIIDLALKIGAISSSDYSIIKESIIIPNLTHIGLEHALRQQDRKNKLLEKRLARRNHSSSLQNNSLFTALPSMEPNQPAFILSGADLRC